MKYLINGVLFMVIVGTIIVGCEKEELPTNIDNSYENTIYQTSKKTLQKKIKAHHYLEVNIHLQMSLKDIMN